MISTLKPVVSLTGKYIVIFLQVSLESDKVTHRTEIKKYKPKHLKAA